MSNLLDGKVALVTGAARSVGRCIAAKFVHAGAAVAVCDIAEQEGTATAKALAIGGSTSFHRLDVREESQWEDVIGAVVSLHGGLHIVVNNAGVEFFAPLRDTDLERARRLLDINIIGTMLGIKHGLRCMAPGGASGRGGVIINIASAAALKAPMGMAMYAASKAAVDKLTKVAAIESGILKSNVRVNCVMPGAVDNSGMYEQLVGELVAAGMFPHRDAVLTHFAQQTPAGRCTTLDEVANAVLYLASDQSRFVNGINLPVDGGNFLA